MTILHGKMELLVYLEKVDPGGITATTMETTDYFHIPCTVQCAGDNLLEVSYFASKYTMADDALAKSLHSVDPAFNCYAGNLSIRDEQHETLCREYTR